MTTIPPRFSSVHHAIRSWLTQTHRPQQVFIFIPPHYRRFKRKRSKTTKSSINDLELLLKEFLLEHADIQPFVESGMVSIVSVERDVGPITRIAGILSIVGFVNDIDYWLVCDDDVSYDSAILATYRRKLRQLNDSLTLRDHWTTNDRRGRYHIGLSLFAETYRLVIPSDLSVENMVMIPHIQGVDTYLFSHEPLEGKAGVLSRKSFNSIVSIIHRKCPSSFYQDDYVASVLFHLAEVHFMSVWENNRKLVHHVDGVSKSHFQMHLDPRVFEREQQTKKCLPTLVPEILQFLQSVADRPAKEDDL